MNPPPLPLDLLAEVQSHAHYQEVDYARLAIEIGPERLACRLQEQMAVYQRAHRRMRNPLRKALHLLYRKGIPFGLFCLGQLEKCRQLARNPQWTEREVFLPKLPPTFDGYRILQLSDFHFDYTPELAGILKERIALHAFDLCVITGDYRGEEYGPYEESLAELEKVRPVLGDPVYAILGNHDCVELLLEFPRMNIRSLYNQAVWLERGGERLLLAGIDDSHGFSTWDFAPIRPQLREAETAILLAHTPEIFREAAAEGYDLMLSGHTHGGQLCLPGGHPVLTHTHNTPRAFTAGAWNYRNLQGYTSRGAGTSTIDCRLNCPGELTLHILRRAP